MDSRGSSLVAELYGINVKILSDAELLMKYLEMALIEGGFSILQKSFHKFTKRGAGVTGIFILAESHAAFHTYPEWKCMTLDVVSCGRPNPSHVLSIISKQLQAKRIKVESIPRLRPKSYSKGISLDGLIFIGVENYERNDFNREIKFRYFQEGILVWGTYQGGEIFHGTIVGTQLQNNEFDLIWQHVTINGELRAGTCISTAKKMKDGRIRLAEQWRYTIGCTGEGNSAVVEVS